MDAPVNMNAYSGLFGDNNYSAIPANMLNAGASDSGDFGFIVANGIKNAAANAIYNMIGGAYQSGQLQQPVQAAPQAPQGMTLLLIGGLLFLAFGGAGD